MLNTRTHTLCFLTIHAWQFSLYRIYMANQQLTLEIKGIKKEKKNKIKIKGYCKAVDPFCQNASCLFASRYY